MKLAPLLLLLLAPQASAQTIVFYAGAVEHPIALSRLPAATLAVRDPTDGGRRKILTGVTLASVLAAQPAPSGADTLAVRANDGWLSLIPLATAARFPEALLALAERRGDQRAQPLGEPRGPVFLAWPNLSHAEVDADRELTPNGWTWAVASLEYVRRVDFAGPLAPPSTAPPVAARGAALFSRLCQHCHAINGAGGRAGWDLNAPNVLSYRSEAWVRGYILDPRRRNPASRMTAFRSQLGPGDLDALIAWFAALAH